MDTRVTIADLVAANGFYGCDNRWCPAGAPNVCLAADMLFLSCQTGLAGAVKNAGRFAAEAEAQVIKIEAGGAYLDVIKAVSDGLALAARRSAMLSR